MNSITEFEYKNIRTEVNYYCKYYGVKNISYNSDFIFSIVLDNYIEYKNTVDYLNNDKIICAVIKTITKRAVIKYISKNVNYDNKIIDEKYTNKKDTFEVIGLKHLKYILDTLYSSLSEKEQLLFELLSSKDLSKKEACKLLNVSKKFYSDFIEKLKKIILKFI